MENAITIFRGIPAEVIKPRTDMAKRILDAQREGIRGLDLLSAYEKPSKAKRATAKYWSRRIYEADGYDIRMPSWNTFQFTIAFTCDTEIEGEDARAYFYITKNHNRVLFLKEEEIDERLK